MVGKKATKVTLRMLVFQMSESSSRKASSKNNFSNYILAIKEIGGGWIGPSVVKCCLLTKTGCDRVVVACPVQSWFDVHSFVYSSIPVALNKEPYPILSDLI